MTVFISLDILNQKQLITFQTSAYWLCLFYLVIFHYYLVSELLFFTFIYSPFFLLFHIYMVSLKKQTASFSTDCLSICLCKYYTPKTINVKYYFHIFMVFGSFMNLCFCSSLKYITVLSRLFLCDRHFYPVQNALYHNLTVM